jgi:hypothetical protein
MEIRRGTLEKKNSTALRRSQITRALIKYGTQANCSKFENPSPRNLQNTGIAFKGDALSSKIQRRGHILKEK